MAAMVMVVGPVQPVPDVAEIVAARIEPFCLTASIIKSIMKTVFYTIIVLVLAGSLLFEIRNLHDLIVALKAISFILVAVAASKRLKLFNLNGGSKADFHEDD